MILKCVSHEFLSFRMIKKNGEILKGGRHTAINSKTLKLSHGGEALLNKESFGSI